MTRSLRVVKPGDDTHAEVSMSEAIMDMATKLVAMNPLVVMVAFELPPETPGAPGRIGYLSVPPAHAVVEGLTYQLNLQLHPDRDDEA